MDLISQETSNSGNLVNPARASPAGFEEDTKRTIKFRGTTRRTAFITYGVTATSSVVRGTTYGVQFSLELLTPCLPFG